MISGKNFKRIITAAILSSLAAALLGGCGIKRPVTSDESTTEVTEDGRLTEGELSTEDQTTGENADTSEQSSEQSTEEVASEQNEFRTEPNTPDEIAYVAYEKYIREHDNDGFYDVSGYDFINLNDDEYPDLSLIYSIGYKYVMSYYDGEVHEVFNAMPKFEIVEGKNIVHSMGIMNDHYYMKLLGDGKEPETLAYILYTDGDSDDPDSYKYYIGEEDQGREVDKKEFDSYLESIGTFTDHSDSEMYKPKLYDAYKEYMGLSDYTFSDEEMWKKSYLESNLILDDDYSEYTLMDANNDGKPEVVVDDVDGCEEVFVLDKFNKVTSLGTGNPVYTGNRGSIYITSGKFQEGDNTKITEYRYYEDVGSWCPANQYDTYDEAVKALVNTDDELSIVSPYEGKKTFYNYYMLKIKIMNFGLDVYDPYLFQCSRFEFADGKLIVETDEAVGLGDTGIGPYRVAYPIAKDCRWYDSTGYDVWGVTTYDVIREAHKQDRGEYESLRDANKSIDIESPRLLILKVRDGVITEIYFSHS